MTKIVRRFQQRAQLDHGIQLTGINIVTWQVLTKNLNWRV